MISTKLFRLVVELVVAAAIPGVTVAPAVADCGDPGQSPCTGPVPTTDQVVAIMSELTDPNIPSGNKTDIVTPGFSPEEAGTIDNHLTRMDAHGRILPLPFIVTDIVPAPNNLAGATVATWGDSPRQDTYGRPIVLVDQGGHWLITHDTAMTELDVFWRAAARYLR